MEKCFLGESGFAKRQLAAHWSGKQSYLKCIIVENESIFPFGELTNEEFLNLYEIDIPSFVDRAPSFEITSDLMNLPYNIDEHLPANINSSYHMCQDISNSDYSQNDFSLLHMNIRSLSCHFDELVSTLVSLEIKSDFDSVLLSHIAKLVVLVFM